MERTDEEIYRFADFAFDASGGELYRADRRVPLRPQAAQVLEYLLRRPGELVRREQLQHLLWGDAAIDAEAGINHCIRQVRRALADSATAPRFVATEPRRGYRFIAAVRRESDAGPTARTPATRSRAMAAAIGLTFLAIIAALVGMLAAPGGSVPSDTGEAFGAEPSLAEPARADYRRARYLLQQLDAQAARRAVPLLERVAADAPDFASGHAALARALLQADPTDAGDVARRHVRRALQIAPAHVEALVVRGDIRSLIDHDWAAAADDFRRALNAAPNSTEALHHQAGLLAIVGDDDGAIELMAKALEIDPVSPLLAGDLAWFHFVARDWPAARAWANRTLELEPTWDTARSVLLHTSDRLGDTEEARRQAVATLRAAGADASAIERTRQARDPMGPYWHWWDRHLAGAEDVSSRVHRAWVHAALAEAETSRGRSEQAVERTEAALDELAAVEAAGYRPLVFFLRDPRFDPLRGATRFRALLHRLGLATVPALVASNGSSVPSPHD